MQESGSGGYGHMDVSTDVPDVPAVPAETLADAHPEFGRPVAPGPVPAQASSRYWKIRGATIEASEFTRNFGVSTSSFPQVIFSFGGAPE